MAGFHSSRSNDNDSYQTPPVLAEINVTPMVDVMLVLLIIFMVSAPLMQQGIQVDLPKTKSPSLNDQEKPIVLVIKKTGAIEIGESGIPSDRVTEKLHAIFDKRDKKEIYIQADKGIPYGTLATVMAQVQAAGILRIGLVTEPKSGEK